MPSRRYQKSDVRPRYPNSLSPPRADRTPRRAARVWVCTAKIYESRATGRRRSEEGWPWLRADHSHGTRPPSHRLDGGHDQRAVPPCRHQRGPSSRGPARQARPAGARTQLHRHARSELPGRRAQVLSVVNEVPVSDSHAPQGIAAAEPLIVRLRRRPRQPHGHRHYRPTRAHHHRTVSAARRQRDPGAASPPRRDRVHRPTRSRQRCEGPRRKHRVARSYRARHHLPVVRRPAEPGGRGAGRRRVVPRLPDDTQARRYRS